MSGTNVGTAYMELTASDKGFRNQISNNAGFAQNTLGSAFKKIGAIAAGAFAVTKLVQFSKECLDLGSNLSEVQNVVDVSFPKMSNEVDSFSKTAASSFGLSETMSKKYIGTFGAMSKAFGFAEKDSYGMSTALTGLAGDVASFYNISQDEAYTKLKSVYTGETETLKDLGVVMTQSALDAYAMANGYGKVTSKMTEQEKVALRFAFVQKQLSLASGDFERTSGGWANQTRMLKLNFDSLKASLGQGLINIFTPVIKIINTLLSKLTTLADGFKSFTDSIFGNAGSGGSGASIVGDLASSADGASESIAGIGDSASKTKKQLNGLRGIDEINNINVADKSDSSGSASIPDIGMSSIGKEVQSTSGFMSDFISKSKELFSVLKQGFKEGLGAGNFDSIKNSLKSIKNSVVEIWTSKEVSNSVNNWVNHTMKYIGRIAGSVASVGITIADNLIGGFSKFLSQNKNNIQTNIARMFDISSRYQEIVGNFTMAFADIFSVFRSDKAKQITADLFAIFSEAFFNVINIVNTLINDLLDIITTPFVNNKDLIKTTMEEMLEPISKILNTVKMAYQNTFEHFWKVYETYIKPSVENIKNGFTSILTTVLTVWNDNLKPIFDRFAEKFSSLWSEHLQPFVNNFMDFIGKLVNGISLLWKTWIQPLIEWIITNIVPVLAPIFETIGNVFMTLWGIVSDVFGGIFKALGGIIDFIVGVFTGDWDKAWSGIKDFFGGIWDAIKGIVIGVWDVICDIVEGAINVVSNIITSISNNIKNIFNGIKDFLINIWNGITNTISNVINGIKNTISNVLNTISNIWGNIWNGLKDTVSNIFNGIWNCIKGVINSILGGIEGMVNGVINGINFMVRAINRIHFDIPDWVPGLGGNSFGFNIPTLNTVSLPRLAQGGYFKANQPTPVIVGDNKTQGEIISPEDKLRKIYREENQNGNSSNSEIVHLLKELINIMKNLGGDTVLNISDTELARAVTRGFKILQSKSDKSIFDFM